MGKSLDRHFIIFAAVLHNFRQYLATAILLFASEHAQKVDDCTSKAKDCKSSGLIPVAWELSPSVQLDPCSCAS